MAGEDCSPRSLPPSLPPYLSLSLLSLSLSLSGCRARASGARRWCTSRYSRWRRARRPPCSTPCATCPHDSDGDSDAGSDDGADGGSDGDSENEPRMLPHSRRSMLLHSGRSMLPHSAAVCCRTPDRTNLVMLSRPASHPSHRRIRGADRVTVRVTAGVHRRGVSANPEPPVVAWGCLGGSV